MDKIEVVITGVDIPMSALAAFFIRAIVAAVPAAFVVLFVAVVIAPWRAALGAL